MSTIILYKIIVIYRNVNSRYLDINKPSQFRPKFIWQDIKMNSAVIK